MKKESRAQSEADRLLYRRDWCRGRILLCDPTFCFGHELRYAHYWVLFSRDDINWNPARSLIVAIPMSSQKERRKHGASDVPVKAEDSPTGKAVFINCGQIRTLDRLRAQVQSDKLCSDDLMKLLEDKVVEVLGLDDNWQRKPPPLF